MEQYFSLCIKEALKASKNGEIPVGAIIVYNNKVVAKGHNNRERDHDILGHAEVNVIKKASKKLKTWKLDDCLLFVTLKPCTMCNNIIKQSRISKVYYLCEKPDIKKEYDKTMFFHSDLKKMSEEYLAILSGFFKDKR